MMMMVMMTMLTIMVTMTMMMVMMKDSYYEPSFYPCSKPVKHVWSLDLRVSYTMGEII